MGRCSAVAKTENGNVSELSDDERHHTFFQLIDAKQDEVAKSCTPTESRGAVFERK